MFNLKRSKKQNETVRYSPLLDSGLDDRDVERRIENGETNKIKNTTEKTYLEIIIRNFFSFFNILMFSIAVVLLVFVGIEVILNLTFLLLAIVNTTIGTFQECKSKKALKKLKLLSQNTIKAVRNGEIVDLYSDDIVLDDVIILSSGDQIPADCIVAEEKHLEVNESLLTGESRAVKKNYNDKLLAGSFIISGSSKVRVVAVGENTYIHSIEAKTKVFKKPESKLMLGINRIIKTLAYIAVPLAVATFINQLFTLGIGEYKTAIQNAGFIIPYMIPAGMLLLSSVSMMSGVVNLSKKNVELEMVEDIAEITAKSINKWFIENHKLIRELEGFGVTMSIELSEDDEKPQIDLDGKTFCITGALSLKRDTYIELIEACGGKVVSGVTSKTSYLVTNDKTTGTTKNKKAQELGIPILNEKELLEMCDALNLLKEIGVD